MADPGEDSERSEDPTQKRLDEALERGDVVNSQEVNTWFVVAGATLILMGFSGTMAGSLATTLRGLLANSHAIRVNGRGFLQVASELGLQVIAAVAVPLLLLALAAVGGNLIQHRLVWSAHTLAPRLSKISPMAGLRRLFSKQALANFIKGLLKLALVGSIMVALLWPQRHRLESMVAVDPAGVLSITRSLSLDLLAAVVVVLALIAAADYLFQYRQWFERQKMSVRELKEEFKQTEGDPAIKGKIKQLRAARMKKRMMAAVPRASVVITNPTHFAVALQYERGMNAPICVAKGIDAIALRIREIAAEHEVPIVENPPLARGYVMRLNRAFARRRT
jgi:flagellar biosynthetic protein FlhB